MAYEEMAMQVDAGDGAVGGGLPGAGMLNGGGMGVPQDEVAQLIDARAKIDARLEQLGVPVAMLNAGAAGGVPGAVPGAEVAMAGGMPGAMPGAGLLG